MTVKTYIVLGKNYPDNDNERINLSSIVGKKITYIYHDHAKNQLHFKTTKGKTLFLVDANNLYDEQGNYFYPDIE